MSKFSLCLDEIIKRSGEPIARIAKNAGLERTSIHKALKDERVLPYSSLKKLIQYFQLTLPEVRELNLYYDMLLQGEDAYQSYSEICHLMSDLSHLHFTSFSYKTELMDSLFLSNKMVQGKAEVEHIILAILHKEADAKAPISLYLNDTHYFTDIFMQFWRNGKDFTVQQIITFRPDTLSDSATSTIQNIRRIRSLLPTALLSKEQYYAYYCYTNDDARESLQPFPYYIVTPNCLLLLNEDCSAIYINTEASLIKFYQKQFEQAKSICQPLISYSNEPLAVLSTYMDNTDQGGYFTIMTQPCTGRYYTREIIEKYMRHDLPYRRELIEMGVERFSTLARLQNNYYTVFTEAGIDQFVEDGYIADLPKAQVLPLDHGDRLLMLQQLRDDIEHDIVCGYIADPDQLPIPQYLTFTCDPKHGLHIYAVDGFVNGGYTCNLHIGAANIGHVFCNFIRFLPNSKYVYSKEQTLKILDYYINRLKNVIRS